MRILLNRPFMKGGKREVQGVISILKSMYIRFFRVKMALVYVAPSRCGLRPKMAIENGRFDRQAYG